jgi:hypothetical protein
MTEAAAITTAAGRLIFARYDGPPAPPHKGQAGTTSLDRQSEREQ